MTAIPHQGGSLKSACSVADVKGRVPGSFRDPAGYVCCADDEYYRVINPCHATTWRRVEESGFAEQAVRSGLLLPFERVRARATGAESAIVLALEKIPFLSYPYEWSFGQLKSAALHTLRLQLLALEFGLTLKDASAYNVQFFGAASIFIDHLSFEEYREGKPWVAYRQFCKHFYAALLLSQYFGFSFLKMLARHIDGYPLEFTSGLLPASTFLSPSIALHIHAHAKMQTRYSDSRKAAEKAKNISVSKKTVTKLCLSLLNAVESVRLPKEKTEWGDYYHDTNYTDLGRATKHRLVERGAAMHGGDLAVDLGANTGVFSNILSKYYRYVIASDGDALAVEKNYNSLLFTESKTVLPLVLDLGNPSPALGWAGEERSSFHQRTAADCMTALALIHHLTMTAGIPLPLIAAYFASLMKKNGVLILEFVPKEDSQAQRMLAAREDIFSDYTKENCIRSFGGRFDHLAEFPIDDSIRTIHFFRKR